MSLATQTDGEPASPEEVAEAAGLVYLSDTRPGIRRVRRGRGFSYVKPDGSPVSADVRDRIAALAIPPAWTDVWIATTPRGHIQATGRDARGRKQYRYHDRWREVRDANKFDRLTVFGVLLPALRSSIDADLRRQGLPRERVLALVVRLLDETLIRVGNSEYAADNDTYGLTTLRRRHAKLNGSKVEFDFVGKGGIEHDVTVADPRLAKLVRRTSELGGQDLFTYEADDGTPTTVTSSDVNDYLRTLAGVDVTAKDFRTWGGTVVVTETLADLGLGETDRATEANIVAAIDQAAGALRNTRTVCRNCYVHPAVIDAYRDGSLLDHWKRARSTERTSRAERATLAVLEDQPV